MLRRLSAALAAALLFTFAAPAQSLATTMLVMDTDQVLNNSAVGIHIRERLAAIGEEITSELSEEETTVRAEVESFNADSADRTEEEIAADEALSTRRTEVQNQVIQLGVSEQVKQRELAATRNAALEPVHAALSEVLEELVEERGADVLVERSLLIYVDEESDITQAVIERLNEKMPSVEVERVRLPLVEEGGGG